MARTTGTTPARDVSSAVGEAIMWTVVGVIVAGAALGWMAVMFPWFSLPLVAVGALWWRLGWPAGTGAAVATVGAWVLWRVAAPVSWRRCNTARWRWRGWWRYWMVYERRWGKVMALNGLNDTLDGKILYPGLTCRDLGPVADVLRVRMLDGQSADDWEARAESLRHSFGAIGVRVRTDPEPKYVVLEVIHVDALADPVSLPPLTDQAVDLRAVPVGVSELGAPLKLRLQGGHVLIGGETGSGKSTLMWAVLAALGPMIRDGRVLVWAMDLKAGMELGPGRPLFARFVRTPDKAAVRFLQEVLDLALTRADRYFLTRVRKLVEPTRQEPFVLVVIDEMASLTAYITDPKLRDEAQRILGRLQSIGRAPGVAVIGAVQEPRMEVIPLRALFPYRLAFRLAEPQQVAMMLGQGARAAGAVCDRIPDTTPGVGYLQVDGVTGYTRVRTFHVTDDDIDAIVATYAPGSGPVAVASSPEDTAWLDDWNDNNDTGSGGSGGGLWSGR